MHECCVCHNVDVWNDNWMYKWIPIGKGMGGYEITAKVCSSICRDKFEEENYAERIKKARSLNI